MFEWFFATSLTTLRTTLHTKKKQNGEQGSSCSNDLFRLLGIDEVKTRVKTRSWIKRRKQRGAFSNIVQELCMEDTASFKESCEWMMTLS